MVYKIQNRNTITLGGNTIFLLWIRKKVNKFIHSSMIRLPFFSQENPARGWPENLGVLYIKVSTSLPFIIAFMARCSALKLLVS